VTHRFFVLARLDGMCFTIDEHWRSVNEMMKSIAIVFFAAALCVSVQTHAGDKATNTLVGVVIEKRANVKSVESWNSSNDPYYVLDMGIVAETYVDGTNRWQAPRKQQVSLRPSDRVSTEKLSGLRGKHVQLRGRYVEGEPYKPADHAEQVPMEPEIRTKPDGTPEFVGSRPARRGSGFVVEEIISQSEMKNTPDQVPVDTARPLADPQH
jgi:hypothetical protein